ncbi:hypothetical protein PLESTM_000730400 [Pleodorina starrii]|nr:hypothetical protein PLESTM_000730400 [Pleodorina starrii]
MIDCSIMTSHMFVVRSSNGVLWVTSWPTHAQGAWQIPVRPLKPNPAPAARQCGENEHTVSAALLRWPPQQQHPLMPSVLLEGQTRRWIGGSGTSNTRTGTPFDTGTTWG